MSIWNNVSKFANATSTAAKNASSQAMSAARQVSASVSDTTKKEKQKNADIITRISNNIYNNGKIPTEGEALYTTMTMNINGKVLTMRILTPVAMRRGISFREQNLQQIRDALISKGIKPAVGNQLAMNQYEQDMKLFKEKSDEITRAEYQANPTRGGRKSRRRGRATKNATHKRSHGTKKSKGKRKSKRTHKKK